jgi:hypothetical protein
MNNNILIWNGVPHLHPPHHLKHLDRIPSFQVKINTLSFWLPSIDKSIPLFNSIETLYM